MSKNSLTTNRVPAFVLVNTVKVTYDATVDGGAIGTIALPFKLNPGELVRFGHTRTITAFAGTSATIGLGFTATAQELLADSAITNYATVGANKALIPVGTVATFYENTTTSVQQLTLIIKTTALTAGALAIFLDVLTMNQ